MTIQWFPGHMAKAIKKIKESRKQFDIVTEVLDARIPLSSRNPVINRIIPDKPRLIILNKTDIADPEITSKWVDYYQSQGIQALPVSTFHSYCARKIENAIIKTVTEKNIIAGKKIKIGNHPVKTVIIGIPNTGKSTIINCLTGKRKEKVGNKPGVTRTQNWIFAGKNILLLDTPGILWPKFEKKITGYHLASTNSIKEENLNMEDIALFICKFMMGQYPENLMRRYAMKNMPANPAEVFKHICTIRQCLLPGNDLNYERSYEILVQEFRNGKLGRISMETPE